MVDLNEIARSFRTIQDEICAGLTAFDGEGRFMEDSWERDGGGGGRSRVMRDGRIIEKGGVNFSEVHGTCSDSLKQQLKNDSERFYATGVSIVLHPHNPHVPIIHMNIRHFALSDGTSWFGGGIDLTPHYVDAEQAKRFHRRLKSVCDRFDAAYYPKFKAWADDYFFIPHRNETRGIGGIFFDDLGRESGATTAHFDFTCAVGRSFVEAYTEAVGDRFTRSFSDTQKQWQLLRRGRYVEFNLVHDRGTRFGLLTNGRTESILMSLPAHASWEYQFSPSADGDEQRTLDLLRKGIDWVNLS